MGTTDFQSIDQLVLMRARMLIFAAFSMGLWQYSWIARDIIQEPSLFSFQLAGWLTVVGAICWLITTGFFIRFNHLMKKANACSVLHDELVVKNWSITFSKSYVLLIGFIVLLIPLLDYWPFEPKSAVRMVAATGIIIPMVLFSSLELKHAVLDE